MKKLLAIAVLGLTAVSGWAQGIVQFQNGGITFPTTADRLVYADRVGGTGLVGTNYAAALFYAPGAGQNLDGATSGTQAGGVAFFRVATTASKGTWLNPAAAGNTRTLDGVLAGTVATLQVRVWDTTKYTSFAQAFAAGEYGRSVSFNWSAPNPGDPPNANYMNNLAAFALVPEPSTIALGILGAASLLALRRRK